MCPIGSNSIVASSSGRLVVELQHRYFIVYKQLISVINKVLSIQYSVLNIQSNKQYCYYTFSTFMLETIMLISESINCF